MLSIAVCDDEKEFNEMLLEKLLPIMESLEHPYKVSCFTGTEDLQQSGLNFDIIFLDIRMPGVNGIDFAKELRAAGISSALIFITAFQEYVFDVFELEAVDYLCKPIDSIRLGRAVRRAVNKVGENRERCLFIQTRNWCKSIKMDTILFCEVINRKIYLHTTNEVIDYYGRLEELIPQLDERFYRCHRSYLINLNHLSMYSDGQVFLTNGEHVPVSKLRQKEFMEIMMKFLIGEEKH